MTATATACPPHHTAYESEHLAANAVTLHRWAFPECRAYNAWEHGGHWHVGHASWADGQFCKTHPKHIAQERRLHGRHR